MTVTYPRKFLNKLSARDVMSRVVQNTEVHYITLNRYRYNEQRSCKDLTDVIEALNGEPADLVKDLAHHVADEARHAMWLTDLLIDLGADVGTPPGMSYIDEFERLLDQDSFKTEDQREDAIISVLASINVTEKRGCEYFAAHIHALESAPQTPENVNIKTIIERIFPEEVGHVRWGTRRLAEMARKSPQHRQKVEAAKRKYAAIEQTAFESGMDITLGAELRRFSRLLDIANTLPLWERPGYLMERLPSTLFSSELQKTRLNAAQKAWQQDPQAFVDTFVPMFFQGIQPRQTTSPKSPTAKA
jgi:hypothetical protein